MWKFKNIWPYFVFIFSILLAVVANNDALVRTIKDNERYQQILTMARKQRTQGQKISRISYQLYLGEDKTEEFIQSLHFWDSLQTEFHNAARDFETARAIEAEHSRNAHKLTERQKTLYTQYISIADNAINKTVIDSISARTTVYVNEIQDFINRVSELAEARLAKNQTRQRLIVILSALCLIAEIFLLVVPYHKKLLLAYKQLKLQKNEIERQKQLLDVLSGDSLLAYWYWNFKKESGFSSVSFKKMFGYEDSMPDNRETWTNLLHPEDSGKVTRAANEHFVNFHNAPLEMVIRMYHADGRMMYVANKIKVMEWNDDGTPESLIATLSDISPIIRAKEDSEKLNQTKDKLFSIIAHDLRGPIKNIKYLIELKQDEIITQEEFLEHVDLVKQNITYLSDAMDNLLTWAQGQMKGFTAATAEVKVWEVVKLAVNLMRESAGNKNISILTSVPTGILALADQDHIFLILRNLLSNAIKFTPENGLIKIAATTQDTMVVISVTDNGMGLSADDINKIRQKNAMFTTMGTEGEKGTGLGLDLCFEMAEKNNGTIEIVSEKGKGSTFNLFIPMA